MVGSGVGKKACKNLGCDKTVVNIVIMVKTEVIL
jgi:hypothetical protein